MRDEDVIKIIEETFKNLADHSYMEHSYRGETITRGICLELQKAYQKIKEIREKSLKKTGLIGPVES